MMKLVVLDRDGVINRDSDAFIKSAQEWRPLDGSLEAIARLSAAGYTVAVASNQSGIARGLLTEQDLQKIHRHMHSLVQQAGGRIDRVVYCPHLPDAGCDCRKPLPGLLRQLSEHYGKSMTNVPVIGDSLRDLDAAIAIGATPLLVLTGNGRKTQQQLLAANREVATYNNLAGAVDALLAAAD